jgi:two-component system response regulator FlrC
MPESPVIEPPVLLVEDDANLREALAVTLELAHVPHVSVGSAEEAISRLAGSEYSMLISDIRLPAADGLTLLAAARERAPGLPVVLMTAYADVALAVRALKEGARDFLTKPFMPDDLVEVVSRHRRKLLAARSSPTPVAHDPASRAVLARCQRVASTDATVLLLGESGVGKDVLARYLHDASPRAGRPYVALNCAAIPENLLESTLFGHERGAFTGANKTQSGKFEQANGGTLFLDEIGEMPIETQAKLLRVLQDGIIERLGGHQPFATNVRLIAATNRDLAERVRTGHFREDLFFRLAVFPLRIPALRERPLDILPLAEEFLARYGRTMGRPGAQLSTRAASVLTQHSWPGNVRELENTIQRALLLSDGDLIDLENLELDTLRRAPALELPLEDTPRSHDLDVKALERNHILSVLAQVGGNRTKAIQILGISERALRYKIKSYREQGFDV